ncbi:apolipoprotein N-acyltransferase [Gloeocapsopsis dulcis]|uniref:Apolipoprotein N-acyltransferase n=1 Tax=Gloeocapsopsis dulcis AAB1 = 1H9 TaxID=1433147 RepID=A0A6N8FXX2_9CHRO|nr:apolipoprotein N-acyltransferase [Gloeocapsopsis dulcis]MUL37923.1 apolipoprotein N-acyltransferase [Gloeocapsopsis dulcis AAB1 = 1H9]WNN87319.1 apolipoprotein N-acyltransferase [Gloeocapsopsis dulcis]
MPTVKPRLSKQHQRWVMPTLVALVSGILMGLTVAPVEAWFLAWIALAPLWVLVLFPTQRLKLLIPLVWGIGYHGVALAWITGVHPMMWMGVPWLASIAIALFCWIAITLWGAVLVTTWAVCMTVFSRGVGTFTRVLIGVALWCGLESLWSLGPLYWSSLSYTQSPHNLVILHLGQISGSLAVTGAIVAVNGLLAEAWIRYQGSGIGNRGLGKSYKAAMRLFASSCLLFVALHLVGFGLYSRPLVQPPQAALKVGIIQGNIPNTIKLYPEGLRRAIAGYTEGYITLADRGVDAVLTPEGALPFMWSEALRTPLYSAVQQKGVTAWIGAFGEQGQSYTNSMFTLTGDGEFSRYDKVKLVPIGEYIPFEQILGGLIHRLSPLEAKQVPGSPDQVFDTPFGRAIAAICYSSAFPEQLRYQANQGGQFILSAANNAHYNPSMPAQHHAQDTMRAIESDRWAVRATNTGYSGIVDPHGKTLWISGLNTYELHAETIYRRTTQTLYVRWGDWLTPLLLGLAVVFKLTSIQASQK